MKKYLLMSVLAFVMVGCSVTEQGTPVSGQPEAPAATQPELPVSEYHQSRPMSFSTLEQLKAESDVVVVADLAEKKPAYEYIGVVFNDNIFKVSQVLHGDQAINNTDITVVETGGEYKGTKFVPHGDELFDKGKYLLFLKRFQNIENHPGDVYAVQGVYSGKFKLTNGKVQGYGNDKVRIVAEGLNESDLIGKTKKIK